MRHREGAELIAPAIKAVLPYVPIPARTWHLLEHLNGQNLQLVKVLPKAAAPLSPLCRYCFVLSLLVKNRNIFCQNRIEVKVLQSHRKCGPGRFLRRAALARGSATTQRLLKSPSFGTFLVRHKKSTCTIGLQKGLRFCKRKVKGSLPDYF